MVEEMNSSGVQNDYYGDNTGRKVGDFCMGFFGPLILFQLLQTPLLIFSSIFSSGMYTMFSSILIFVLALFLGIFFFIKFKKTRRYISMGIISSVVIPLILFGACWVLFSGLNGI